MIKKKTGLAAIFGTLVLAGVAILSPTIAANATVVPPVCVPDPGAEAFDEIIIDAEAYDETVIDSAAINLWYSWTGGPSDSHPFPSADWQVDQGNHNGFPQAPGLLQRDHGHSGNSDFFYHEVVAEVSHVEHYDEVTHVEHHDAIPPTVCPPDKPADYTLYGKWHDGEYECGDLTVTQSRHSGLYSFELVNNVWVALPPVFTLETQVRDLTSEELDECAGPEPEQYSTFTEWEDGDYDCDDTEVTQTRERHPFLFLLIAHAWVAQAQEVTIETQTRELTAEELAALADSEACATVIDDPPPTATPTATPTALPHTGTDPLGWLIAGILGSFAGVGLLLRKRLHV